MKSNEANITISKRSIVAGLSIAMVALLIIVLNNSPIYNFLIAYFSLISFYRAIFINNFIYLFIMAICFIYIAICMPNKEDRITFIFIISIIWIPYIVYIVLSDNIYIALSSLLLFMWFFWKYFRESEKPLSLLIINGISCVILAIAILISLANIENSPFFGRVNFYYIDEIERIIDLRIILSIVFFGMYAIYALLSVEKQDFSDSFEGRYLKTSAYYNGDIILTFFMPFAWTISQIINLMQTVILLIVNVVWKTMYLFAVLIGKIFEAVRTLLDPKAIGSMLILLVLMISSYIFSYMTYGEIDRIRSYLMNDGLDFENFQGIINCICFALAFLFVLYICFAILKHSYLASQAFMDSYSIDRLVHGCSLIVFGFAIATGASYGASYLMTYFEYDKSKFVGFDELGFFLYFSIFMVIIALIVLIFKWCFGEREGDPKVEIGEAKSGD